MSPFEQKGAREQYIDLHIHSTASDGLFSPERIVEVARKRRLTAIAITDHDTISPSRTAYDLGKQYGIEVLPGIELSITCLGSEVHLLGYYVDRQSAALKEYANLLLRSRYERALLIVKALNKMGIAISYDSVLNKANGAPIGRPHIAEVLLDEGYVFSTYEAFEKYLGENKPANVPKVSVEPERAIAMIKEAGGLAFVAHPATIENVDEVLKKLINLGVDGLETIHPKHDAETQKHFREIAKQHGLLESGGSDCHGGRDGTVMIGMPPVPRAFLERIKARLH